MPQNKDLDKIYYLFQDSNCKHWFRDNADMLYLATYLVENGIGIKEKCHQKENMMRLFSEEKVRYIVEEMLCETFGLCNATLGEKQLNRLEELYEYYGTEFDNIGE